MIAQIWARKGILIDRVKGWLYFLLRVALYAITLFIPLSTFRPACYHRSFVLYNGVEGGDGQAQTQTARIRVHHNVRPDVFQAQREVLVVQGIVERVDGQVNVLAERGWRFR